MSDNESWRLAAFAADSGLKKKTEKVETKMKKTEEEKSVGGEEKRVACREYDTQDKGGGLPARVHTPYTLTRSNTLR
jgi:hypothetical protein